ncbi:MAG: HAMP domain-containing sensor histidine kinase, partial [Melioribacteraceae bacterium]
EVELKIKATKTAESAIKMKTEFLAQMSHEIRTPVNSILSYTQLLKDEVIDKVPEDLRFSFDMINNGGRRLIRTIDLILNVSELQTGTYEPIIEKTDIVTNIVKPLVGEFQSTANVKDLDLIFFNRLETDEAIIKVDIYTVTQIVANLIDNAIKYTAEGSIEVVAYKTKENLFCVDIQDTGIGISEKFQETLFEAFTQEEQGYTRKFEGNGLGMALVKEYCKINNIQISVNSVKGEGSTFTITFPETQVVTKDAA